MEVKVFHVSDLERYTELGIELRSDSEYDDGKFSEYLEISNVVSMTLYSEVTQYGISAKLNHQASRVIPFSILQMCPSHKENIDFSDDPNQELIVNKEMVFKFIKERAIHLMMQ